MEINTTSVKVSSDGAWQGDNPLHYAFPLLLLQTTLVIVISRSLAFLLKPLRQPKVIAEILGGILLGPSALGKNKDFLRLVFPSWSTLILESVAEIGLLFFLFLVGLELDLSSIRRSGRRAIGIALAGITLSFLFGTGVTFLLRKSVPGEDKVQYTQCLVFISVSLSITAFPVLARILAELKLLTTQIGETAMSAAAFNDVVAWVLLALAIALAGDGSVPNGPGHKSLLVSIWVLISGAAFVTFMLVIIRPAMNWVSKKCPPEHDIIDEAYICLTLAGVMVSGFMTDLIGVHAIFGAFVFGLMIPKKGPFAGRLIKRIEDFVSGLLLPLYFASSGLKTDIATIRGAEAWGLLVLVISTACVGKIFGTFVVAMLCKTPVRESLALGVLMNTRGLVELIVLNIGKEKKVLNDEMFAILVLMALFTTFMTTPILMAIYKPARGIPLNFRRRLQPQSPLADDAQDELRVLACYHGQENVTSLINLIESTRTTKKSSLKLYAMHLVELTDRPSSIMMVQQARKNGFPFIKRFLKGEAQDQATSAFEAYNILTRVDVRPVTAVSVLSTMHEDICHVAEDKRVAMIILPYHMGHGWRRVNQRVLKHAACSVAVFVDRGFIGGDEPRRVCVVFFGGPDDREALELGGRMVNNATVRVTVVRFVEKPAVDNHCISLQPSKEQMNHEREKELDDAAITKFQKKWENSAQFIGKVTSNAMEEVLTLERSGDFELIVVGKSHDPSKIMTELADNQIENSEVGPIGDLLASHGTGVVCSVLVIQQHNMAHEGEPMLSKIDQEEGVTTLSDELCV